LSGSFYGGTVIGGRRVLHTDAEIFASGLAFPAHTLVEREIHRDSAGYRAALDAIAAEPAFVRIDHDRRLALLQIGQEHVRATGLDTGITALALLGVDRYAIVRGSGVRHHIYCICHDNSPK
jgi:hypothetical protein